MLIPASPRKKCHSRENGNPIYCKNGSPFPDQVEDKFHGDDILTQLLPPRAGEENRVCAALEHEAASLRNRVPVIPARNDGDPRTLILLRLFFF